MIEARDRRVCYGVILWIALAFSGAATSRSAEAEPDLHVGGDVSKPGDWSVTSIRRELAADVTSVKYESKGQQHESNCVPLLSLLKAAGAQTDLKMDPKAEPKSKNENLRLVVLVVGRDGYTVAFSLAELIAEVGNRPAWIALDVDGQPLKADDGPMRLIVPEDKRPARWVHAIRMISVVNPITKPAQ